MKIESPRFGALTIAPERSIEFPRGRVKDDAAAPLRVSLKARLVIMSNSGIAFSISSSVSIAWSKCLPFKQEFS